MSELEVVYLQFTEFVRLSRPELPSLFFNLKA